MSRLARWFPVSCSRLNIFVCYAHEDRKLAEEIAQALTNDGHKVFIDANKLKVSGDFNEAIRRAIESADRFVFLISKYSMGQGKYPQTELDFAKDRWPSPQGALWPVLVDPTVDVAQLPVYLRSVQIHAVKGNAAAELAAAIEKSRSLQPRCILGALGAFALLVGGAWYALAGLPGSAKYALLAPQQVDFRPSKKPGPEADWMKSPLAITLIPVQYSNEGSKPVHILNETVTLKIKDRAIPFKWFNVVNLKSACDSGWLCVVEGVGADTLKPDGTMKRETMFMPAPGETATYQDFLDGVCSSKEDTLDVLITGEANATAALGKAGLTRTAGCRINLKALREGLEKLGCKTGFEHPPVRVSPVCLGP